MANAQTQAQPMEFYLGGAVTYSETDVDSGGFNTAGGFPNFLGDSEDGVGFSLVMGLDNLVQFGNGVSLRGETEFNWRPDQNYITGSFPGPPGPPTFLYRTSVEESFSVFANLFVDVEVFSPFSVFGGGGIGFAHHDVTTTDFVVAGASSDTEFAYHVGGGVIFDLTQSVSIIGGARYMDLGTSDTPLDGGASGNYTLDHEVVEGRIGVNIKLGPLAGAP